MCASNYMISRSKTFGFFLLLLFMFSLWRNRLLDTQTEWNIRVENIFRLVTHLIRPSHILFIYTVCTQARKQVGKNHSEFILLITANVCKIRSVCSVVRLLIQSVGENRQCFMVAATRNSLLAKMSHVEIKPKQMLFNTISCHFQLTDVRASRVCVCECVNCGCCSVTPHTH